MAKLTSPTAQDRVTPQLQHTHLAVGLALLYQGQGLAQLAMLEAMAAGGSISPLEDEGDPVPRLAGCCCLINGLRPTADGLRRP